MNVLLLLAVILGISGQDIAKKIYTEKTGEKGAYVASSFGTFFALLFFVVTSKNMTFETEFLPYSIAFGLSFSVTAFFGLLAVANGPLSLSSLIISYSLMIPTVYGLIFLKEDVSVCLIIGILMVIISLFLINKKNDKCPITPKWLIFIFITFAGNGLCSTFQKMQQVAFNGEYKNEFMIVALAIVVVIFAVISLFTNKGKIKEYLYHARFTAPVSGLLCGLANMMVMVLSGRMPVSLMFPIVSAGGIVVTYLISKYLYKENLSRMQFYGLIIGIASIVLLSI